MSKKSVMSPLLIAMLSVVMVCFQNCSSRSGTESNINGDVYEGRPIASGLMTKMSTCPIPLIIPQRSMTVDIDYDHANDQIRSMIVFDGLETYVKLDETHFVGRNLKEPVVITGELKLLTFLFDATYSAIYSDLIFQGKTRYRQQYCAK